MKKTLCLLLVLALSLTSLCAALADMTEPGTFPITSERKTITIMAGIADATKGDLENYWETKYIEELYNVDIVWKVFPFEQFKEKVSMAFISGEKIDLILRGNSGQTAFSTTEVAKFAEQGFILPLNDLIDNNTYWLKQRFEENPDWKTAYITPDGNIYCIPKYNEAYHTLSPSKMYINRLFLENLGMAEPKTTEEFKAYLKAAVENDGNGNGEKDELGLVGCAGVYVRLTTTFIMQSAFSFDDGLDRLYLEDGVVTASYTNAEFLEGLKYMNDLYNEGLIYPGSFTQDVATAVKLNSQKDESIVAALANQHYGTVGTRAEGETARQSEYMGIGPLLGESGRQSAFWNYYLPFEVTNGGSGFIPTTCSDPELAIRFLDYFYSDEGSLMMYLGQEGVTWEKPAEGELGIDGRPALYKTIAMSETDPMYNKIIWGNLEPGYVNASLRLSVAAPADEFAANGTGAEAHYYNVTKDKYNPYAMEIEEVLPPLYYTEEQVSDIAQYKTQINACVDEIMIRFIIGDLDVNNQKAWDDFQAELKALGLDDYLAIVQAAYDVSAYKE